MPHVKKAPDDRLKEIIRQPELRRGACPEKRKYSAQVIHDRRVLGHIVPVENASVRDDHAAPQIVEFVHEGRSGRKRAEEEKYREADRHACKETVIGKLHASSQDQASPQHRRGENETYEDRKTVPEEVPHSAVSYEAQGSVRRLAVHSRRTHPFVRSDVKCNARIFIRIGRADAERIRISLPYRDVLIELEEIELIRTPPARAIGVFVYHLPRIGFNKLHHQVCIVVPLKCIGHERYSVQDTVRRRKILLDHHLRVVDRQGIFTVLVDIGVLEVCKFFSRIDQDDADCAPDQQKKQNRPSIYLHVVMYLPARIMCYLYYFSTADRIIQAFGNFPRRSLKIVLQLPHIT